ncbi:MULTISPECIES: TetR/AcrR family transcriptional regulator [Burkholderia]|uniref:TetR family transcriptional regulator n=1 Tax=Burkholderia mayonis TaxID=1385591 RepID=A0A1B4FPV7_9BURK|nr:MULTISPECIES: TetR/AcrR family transcriptional regulator [Burkholderia]AOJ05694.1 TetR family transcriptional regulator [Burkholderia mayonis]KVE45619.1 TetR family transcriptional regulator [Burkholderia sp. BDU5]KVE46139.1 TetR family transcriptional regulator [Burkholderia mayonis]
MRYKTSQREQGAPKTPRTKPAEVRLEELMAAAEKLLLVQGVEATTINEIVELAEVAKGTFYHYFASKNELLEAMGQRYTAQYLSRLKEAVDACAADDWLGQLRAWIRTSIEAYVETYRTHDIVYIKHHHHERNNREKNAILDQLQGILSGGEQAGVWQLTQPRITALLIYSGVHGATDDVIAVQETDYSAFARAVTAVCLRVVGIADEVEAPKPRRRSR